MNKKLIRLATVLAAFALVIVLGMPAAHASQAGTGLSIQMEGLGTGEGTDIINILITLTLIALLPSILIMTTCFTRIVIVLSCVRNAIGLQQTPPNQVLVGIALFLSLFVMTPVVNQINEVAYQPYQKGELTQMQAAEKAIAPIREFMLKNTNSEDLNLFLSLGHFEQPATTDDIPTTAVIPAFVTSELKRAFLMGFLVYLPFLVIDMVVASTLMSMGMVMLPPVLISLPFKLLLFVLVDGWTMTLKALVTGFN